MTRFATTFNAPSELLSSLGSKTGISLQSAIHDIMICPIYINWDASLMKISRGMVDWFQPEGRDYVEFFWSSLMKSQTKLKLVKCVRINMEKSKVQEFFPRILVPDMQNQQKKLLKVVIKPAKGCVSLYPSIFPAIITSHLSLITFIDELPKTRKILAARRQNAIERFPCLFTPVGIHDLSR